MKKMLTNFMVITALLPPHWHKMKIYDQRGIYNIQEFVYIFLFSSNSLVKMKGIQAEVNKVIFLLHIFINLLRWHLNSNFRMVLAFFTGVFFHAGKRSGVFEGSEGGRKARPCDEGSSRGKEDEWNGQTFIELDFIVLPETTIW